MSVAFRRESDDEHLEPKFERPIPPGPNLVTPRGLALIAAEVARHEAMAAQAADETARAAVARDLRYWRARAATARPAPPPPDDEVGFGTRVRYRLDGVEAEMAIVGVDEADPEAGLVAFTAPLARAMIGAGEGDLLPLGDRADRIAILSIRRSAA